MKRSEWVDHYVEKLSDKNFDMMSIQKELKGGGLDQKEINIIVRLVDNKRVLGVAKSASNKSANSLTGLGILVLGVGLLVTVGTFTGFIAQFKYFYVVAYGPMLIGLGLIISGLAKKRA